MNTKRRAKNSQRLSARLIQSVVRSPDCRPSSGFTLLEMMLVIGIIVILAGLLFPVIIGARAKVREKQAAAETRTILMAIKAYRQEYGKWPAQWQAAQDVTYVTNNYLVIQPLLGSNLVLFDDRQLNPKNKIFLNLQVNTNNNPDYAGNYLDPWSIPYVICIDQNGDNSLSLVWSNTPPMAYAANNTLGRQIGDTNIYLTNRPVANVDVGVASLGGTPDTLRWNTWTEMP